MTRLWLLLHFLGFAMWMGAGYSSMVAGIRGRREERNIQGAVARLQAALGRLLIGPGALLTLVSGVFLSLRMVGNNGPPSVWLMVMQGAGVIAAGLTLFVVLPTVSRLARINPVGETSALFDALRLRHAVVGSISGTLGLIALLAGVMNRI
jgi:hypothetical protein